MPEGRVGASFTRITLSIPHERIDGKDNSLFFSRRYKW